MLKLRKPGQALLEYMTLIVFILGALLVMQKYIARGFSGRWKDTGDSFSQGRLYDPQTSISCAFDYVHYNKWYSVNLFEKNGCARKCFSEPEPESYLSAACKDCICRSQRVPECEETTFGRCSTRIVTPDTAVPINF